MIFTTLKSEIDNHKLSVWHVSLGQIAPVAVSDAAMLAPEEVFSGKGDIKEEAELTQAERKRRRANKKRKFKGKGGQDSYIIRRFFSLFILDGLPKSSSLKDWIGNPCKRGDPLAAWTVRVIIAALNCQPLALVNNQVIAYCLIAIRESDYPGAFKRSTTLLFLARWLLWPVNKRN